MYFLTCLLWNTNPSPCMGILPSASYRFYDMYD